MARYNEAVCRLCRREGQKLFLKGARCYTDKCAIERRNYAPGQHGQGRRQKISEYGLHLREKQKVRRIYGVLERQFRRYFEMAEKKRGITGEILLQILESRLDNIVYRAGFAESRAQARQMVRHGHISVDGRKVNIPSYLVDVGSVVAIRERGKKLPQIAALREEGSRANIPEWISVDVEDLKATVDRLPAREEIDAPVEEHLIVELYSR